MAVQLVLGRSGTGKTSHCVRAIAAALREPSEQPLLFLVPEQATYQAERAILSDPRIGGYHRLHILSFERLQFLLLGHNTARPTLSRIGRQMIVHKILRDNLDKLRIFGSSALLPGFAREMAATITELHQYAKNPEDIESLLAHLGGERAKAEDGGQKAEDGWLFDPQLSSLGGRVRTTHHHPAIEEPVRNTHPAEASNRLSALKFADIGLVFRLYNEALQDQFIDPDAQITRACRVVAKADFIRGARLWVDGFASFTGGEMALLIEVLKAVDHASIALCLDPVDCGLTNGRGRVEGRVAGILPAGAEPDAQRPFGPGPPSDRGPEALGTRGRDARDTGHRQPALDAATRTNFAATGTNPAAAQTEAPAGRADPGARAGLFEPTARTYRDLLERLAEAKVKVGRPVILDETPRFRDCPALAHVERNIFRPGAQKAKAEGSIRLVAAPSLRLEIQAVARQILDLVRERDYRYRDIAVVASDLSHYEQYVRAYFEDYGIPFFIDKRKPLSQHPVIELVCAALQAVTTGLAPAEVFACLKTGLVPMAAADLDTLENYCLAFGVDGRDWADPRSWRFQKEGDEDFDEDEIDRLRRVAIAPLLELRRALCPEGDLNHRLAAGEFTRVIFAFLDKLHVRGTVGRWVAEAHDRGDLTTADEHRQFFDSFVDLFDALVEIFGPQEMTARDYFGLLASAFSQMTLAFIPPKLDQVLVGSIERSRHPNLRAIFLLGATQKQFPIPLAGSGVLSDEDRDAAEAADFQIAPSSTQSLTDRQYLAYIAFTRPSQFLCISYPCVDEKSNPIMRSHFIDELQSLFEDVAEEFVADDQLSLAEVQNTAELGELLCTRLGRDRADAAGAVPASWRAGRAAALRAGAALASRGHPGLASPDSEDGATLEEQGQDALATEEQGRDALATCSSLPDGQAPDDKLAALLTAMQSDDEYRPLAGQIVSALSYENRAVLEPGVAKELFGPCLRASATRLATFAACPYQHFARYVLGLKLRPEFKLEPLDLGNFYHAALDSLQKRLAQEQTSFADIEDDRLVQMVREQVAKLAQDDSFLAQFIRRSAHNAFVIASAGRVLEECAGGLCRIVRAGSFRPCLSEVEFGRPPYGPGRLGRFELRLPDGRILSLDGKIDRLDVARIGGRKVALILDYKRSKSGAFFDWGGLYHGLDVQLAIYLLAVHHGGAAVADEVAGAVCLPIETTPASATLAEAADAEGPRKFPYKAAGVFNGAYWRHLDANADKGSAFYNFHVTRDQEPYGNYGRTNILRPAHFAGLLDWARDNLIRLATELVSGRIEARPYHRGSERACTHCDYRGVCHFDWQINDYHFLPPVGKSDLIERLERT